MSKAGSFDVGVVVVNWNSLWFTSNCLDSLKETEYDRGNLEIVVVDNGSIDGSLERLRTAHPWATFIANGENLGFAEGCNRGIRSLRGVAAVALVNNDATVEPDWLEHLVSALDADATAGAAAALLILEPGFVRVDLDISARSRLESVRVDGSDVTSRCLVEGGVDVGDPAWPLRIHREIRSAGVLWVPARPGVGKIEIELQAVDPTSDLEVEASIQSGEAAVHRRRSSCRVDVAVGNQRTDLSNGLGTARTQAGEGYDIGYGMPVEQVLAERTAIDGFCGGGVLLRSETLTEVGLFDPRFFAYYEDSDLSWRMQRAGWSVIAAPGARIRHSFGGSGGSAAPWFFFLNYRNWFLTSLRNGGSSQRRAALQQVREWIRPAFRGNILSRLRHGNRPSFRLATSWMRVLLGILIEAPRILWQAIRKPAKPVGARETDSVRSVVQPRPAPGGPRARSGGPTFVTVDRELFTCGLVTAEELAVVDATPSLGVEVAIIEQNPEGSGWRWSSPWVIAEILSLPKPDGPSVDPRPTSRLDVEVVHVAPDCDLDGGSVSSTKPHCPPGPRNIVRITGDSAGPTALRAALASAGVVNDPSENQVG